MTLKKTLPRELIEIHLVKNEDLSTLFSFDSNDVDLNDFIRTDALRLQELNVARTYIACFETHVIGYVTLVADAILLETRERKIFQLSATDHSVIPALKIARLAVSFSIQNTYRGTGEMLVAFAFLRALAVAEQAGCRLLTVDAWGCPEIGSCLMG